LPFAEIPQFPHGIKDSPEDSSSCHSKNSLDIFCKKNLGFSYRSEPEHLKDKSSSYVVKSPPLASDRKSDTGKSGGVASGIGKVGRLNCPDI
jgi:hypothetical protein